MGSRAGMDGRKISSPPGFDPGPPSPQSVAIPTELLGQRQNVDLYKILDSDKYQNLVELALQTFSILEEFTYVNFLQHEQE